MEKIDYLVVGGSAAGTTAAEVIRGLKPEATITIVTDEDHEQYSRVLIPHYIRHKVTREQVFMKKPGWYTEKGIVIVKGKSAKSLDVGKKIVTLNDGEEIEYGKLLITVGGYVNKLNISGSDLRGVLYLRTIEDADEIIVAASKSKSGVIIGGGFIGLEFASCFMANGVKDITVLVKEPYFWDGKLDEDSAKVLSGVLERNGVTILTGQEVDRFEPIRGSTPNVGLVVTKAGKKLEAGVVGIGIGISSDLSFLRDSGVQTKRGVLTNEYLETNVEDIYAAGDCAEFYDVIFERQHIIGNWANATSQGLAVGKTMAGEKALFETASSYSVNFFDGSCSFIGITEKDYADEIIARGSVEENKMTRVFIKVLGGVTRIVGATVINSPSDVAPISTAIKRKIDVVKIKEQIGKDNFDLKSLIL